MPGTIFDDMPTGTGHEVAAEYRRRYADTADIALDAAMLVVRSFGDESMIAAYEEAQGIIAEEGRDAPLS